LANPGRFLLLSERILPWLRILTPLAFALGLFLALVGSPPDYQQGDTVRIMYVHVPAAWMALLAYLLMAAASLSALVWRHPLADIAAEAVSPVGAAFTFIALVTGSLWGKPMWGAFWVWDARLTSFLLLFFLYLGHMALLHAFDDRMRGRRSAAILALVGALNLPVIKYSVDWWNTLHQPASILRAEGPSIDASMLWPLSVMALAFHLFLLAIVLLRMRALLMESKTRRQGLDHPRGTGSKASTFARGRPT
jgi:heme exporter protein C